MFIFLAVLPIDHKAPFSDAWQFRGRGHLRVAFYAPSDWANSSQLSYLKKLFRPIFCEISLAPCFQLPRRSPIHSWNLLSRSSSPNASALFDHPLVFILSLFSVFWIVQGLLVRSLLLSQLHWLRSYFTQALRWCNPVASSANVLAISAFRFGFVLTSFVALLRWIENPSLCRPILLFLPLFHYLMRSKLPSVLDAYRFASS